MDVSSHTVFFPAGDTVPDWIHLIPAGTFKGDDGRGPYHLRDPQKVITASMAAKKLPLDENHSTQLATSIGGPSPARGWIVEMQSREDGIWGRVDWTETGTALMTDKAYKGISPVFTHDKNGNVLLIKSAALTNNPNLAALIAMHTAANPEDIMDKLAICTVLGLAGTVDDAAVLTALQTTLAENTRLTAALEALTRTSVPAAQVIALQTQLDTLTATAAREKAVAFVDAAIKAGKPITAVRDVMIAQHVANPVDAETLIGGLPSIHAAGAGGKKVTMHDANDGDGEEMMTAADLAICQKMGVSKEQFMANQKRMKATTEGSAV